MNSTTRSVLFGAVFGSAVVISFGTYYFVAASPKSVPTPPSRIVVVRRASDGKVLKVGDEVAQLKKITAADGKTSCEATRAGTEISIESFPGDNTEVTEDTDKDCRVTIVRIGPPQDTYLPGGVVQSSPETQAG